MPIQLPPQPPAGVEAPVPSSQSPLDVVQGQTIKLHCIVTPTGILTKRSALGHVPNGSMLIEHFVSAINGMGKVRPATRDGQPVQGEITIPITLHPNRSR